MAPVFDDQTISKISYALEKLGDFIRDSGTGARPGYADTGSKVIIDSLQAFEEEVLARQISPSEREHRVGNAIYAICELQSFVTGDKSDIANRKAARVYVDFLTARIDELRRWERDWDA